MRGRLADLCVLGPRFSIHRGHGIVTRVVVYFDVSSRMPYCPRMATTVERLIEQALKLPGESRARIADLLVESLDAEALGQIDRLWMTEAKHRRDDVRAGRVETVSGEQARRSVRNAIKR